MSVLERQLYLCVCPLPMIMITDEADVESILNLSASAFRAWLNENGARLGRDSLLAGKKIAEARGDQGNLAGALHLLDIMAQLLARAVNCYPEGVDPLAMAVVWRGRANVLQRHERYAESLLASRQAVALYEQHGSPFDIAVARTVEVITLGATERFEEAIALAHWIRPHFEEKSFTFGLARLAGALAQVYMWAWRLTEALAEYQRALALFEQENAQLDVAWTLHNLGALANRMDQLDLAQAYYTRAYPLLLAHQDWGMMVKTQLNLAQLYLRQGRYAQALNYLAQVRADLTHLPDAPDAGYVDFFEAQARRGLHELDQAERLLQRALARFERLGRRLEATGMLVELGQMLAGGGQPHKLAQGLDYLEQAHAHLVHLQVPLLAAWVRLEQAELLQRLGRSAEAAQRAAAASTLFAATALSLRRAQADVLTADCIRRVAPAQARRLYATVLQAAGDPVSLLAMRAWRGLGWLAMADGNSTQAEEAYGHAVEILETLRRTLPSHSQQAGFLEDQQALHEELLATLHAQAGHEHQLFAWLERFKASALADLLIGQPPDETLDEELRSLLAEREALAKQLDQRMDSLHSGALLTSAPQRVRSLVAHDAYQQEEMAELRGQLRRIDEQVARKQHPAQAWRNGRVLDANMLYDLLNNESVLVSYYTVQGQLFALSATYVADDLQVHSLHTPLHAVEQAWKQVARLMEQPGGNGRTIQGRLAQLWQMLIAPLEMRLRDKRRLVILPYRSLCPLPFSCLWDEDNGCYLLQRWSVQYAPSATVLTLCQQQPRNLTNPLFVGYPGTPGQRGYLPAVQRELAALADLLPEANVLSGESATAAAVMAHMPGRSFVHLAGHAHFDRVSPLESGMPLAGGRWLRAADLYVRYGCLQGATVVLSGCEAGRGHASGGDVLGLTSAFLYAGAAAILAGLWRVDDEATAELMVAFYRELAGGLDTAEALRLAQLALLGSNRFTAPSFWAPFVLSGDSRTRR